MRIRRDEEKKRKVSSSGPLISSDHEYLFPFIKPECKLNRDHQANSYE